MAANINKVKSTTLYEQVSQQIENIIFRGEYKKGELLPSERELIELTGVSRITVREALRHLAEVGIIETHKGKGSVVIVSAAELVQLTANKEKYQQQRRDFENSTKTRILIEPEIAKQVAETASSEAVVQIGECLNNAHIPVAGGHGAKNLESFHRSIVTALHNPILTELFDNLTVLEAEHQPALLIPPSMQVSVASQLQEHHRKIFEAIKSGNGEFAYFYMKEHLCYLQQAYHRYFNHYYK